MFVHGGNDGFGDQVRVGCDPLGLNTLECGAGLDRLYCRQRAVSPLLFDPAYLRIRDAGATFKVTHWIARHDLKCHDFSARQQGQCNTAVDCFLGQFRAVCGDQNLFVHGCLLLMNV